MSAPTAREFKWNDLPADKPLENLERRRVIGEQAMISHVLLRQGCHVPTHRHANEQFTCVLRGRLKMGIGDEAAADRRELVLEPGAVLHLPSNVPHSADALEETLVLDVFSPPSERTGIDRR